jgi:hypothetical protein
MLKELNKRIAKGTSKRQELAYLKNLGFVL